MAPLRHVLAVALAAASIVQVVEVRSARACGCLSPPAVAVTASEYAVAQSSEQIIFEVTPGWVTAHVLIQYAGSPSQFAWLVPVPEVPDLSISPVSAFGLLDQATAPVVNIQQDSLCPQSQWQCHYPPAPTPSTGCMNGGGVEEAAGGDGFADAGAFGGGGGAGGAFDAGTGTSPVNVLNQQVVGDYQTVTFAASNAAGAVQWLHDNGFVVNDSTSIYMESYIQANMVFVAAKLVPGAGINAIKPLRMHYRAAYPSIPLILTAIAAQPNLTVTAFVFGDQAFRPQGHPVITVPTANLAQDPTGRINYPMVLARAIDDGGGDAFAIEYRGNSSPSTIGEGQCCGGGDEDFCGLGNDGVCECPADAFDATDCASQGDLIDGATLVRGLGSAYSNLTRITTRISPEEMTFDPAFEPDDSATYIGQQFLTGVQPTLGECASQVVDQPTYQNVVASQACAAMYCGPNSECVITSAGPACACGSGAVATGYIDLDDRASVTCEPATPPADLHAGSDVLPDACVGADCGAGSCSDRNGVPVCTCNDGAAAVLGATPGAPPKCEPITLHTHVPGATDYATQLHGLAVCAPAPPACGTDGWLQKDAYAPIVGLDCGNATPPSSLTQPKDGSGCASGGPSPAVYAGGAWFVLLVLVRRKRRVA